MKKRKFLKSTPYLENSPVDNEICEILGLILFSKFSLFPPGLIPDPSA